MTFIRLRSLVAPLLCGLAILVIASPSRAESQLAPGFVDRSLSNGIDQFTVQRRSIGAASWLSSPDESRALRVQSIQFSDGAGWSALGAKVSALYREKDVSATANAQVELALASARGRARFIGEASHAWRLAPSTGIEVLAASDWVDTPRAFDEGLTSNYIGATVEQRLLPGLTATALAGYQPISDGNARTITKARLNYELLPQLGVALQAGYRALESNGREVADLYFNPATLEETTCGITLRRSFARVRMEAEARYGERVLEGLEHAGTTFSVGLTAPLAVLVDEMPAGSRFTLRGQYSGESGTGAPSPVGSRQISVGLELPL